MSNLIMNISKQEHSGRTKRSEVDLRYDRLDVSNISTYHNRNSKEIFLMHEPPVQADLTYLAYRCYSNIAFSLKTYIATAVEP